MTRRWLPALATMILMSCAASGRAETLERRLPNGLQVLLVPDPAASAVDVAVWYATGPADEPAGRSGLTHLMERMMFHGSKQYGDGEYARRMRELGASFNTFLAPDFSEFHSTGPSASLEGMLRLEADRMAGQRLTAATLATEIRALRNEQRRLGEVPLSRGLQELYSTAFGSHPYGRPLQGRSEDAARLTLPALTEFARARYVPGNALVTVVGNFEPASAESMVARSFGAVPARPTPTRGAARVPAGGERRGRVRLPARLLMAAWNAPPDSACGVEMAVIAHVLGGGSRPRLTSELVRKQRLAINASCVFDGRRSASLLYTTALVPPASDSGVVEFQILDQVERLAREPLTEAELEGARKALLLAARVEQSGVRGRAQALGLAHMTSGHWSRADRRLERIASISAEDVRKVAEQVLREGSRTVIWGTPTAAPARPAPRPAAKPAATPAASTKGGRP